tara:strand:- start:38 stop:166 length:129 start_codon:yes stop_codon:yes gene_type:complete
VEAWEKEVEEAGKESSRDTWFIGVDVNYLGWMLASFLVVLFV